MPFFGRKRKEEKEIVPELPPLSLLDQISPSPAPQEEPGPREAEKPVPTTAPLFVKIDRYRQVLNTIGNLKTSLIVVKNSMATLDQIERARTETFSIVADLVDKMDQKLVNLDNELLRPAGFHSSSESSPEYQDVRSIEATVAELRGQIETLKSELGKAL